MHGGIIHTYLGYDPKRFPSPTKEPPDVAGRAFEHMLMFGESRPLTDEELANAIEIDPADIKGLGPSLDSLIAMLEERKRRILETYSTREAQDAAAREATEAARGVEPPQRLRSRFERAVRDAQLNDLEQLWYAAGGERSEFGRKVLPLITAIGNRFEVEQLASKYAFTGRTGMSVPQTIEIKEELEAIDALLEQLRRARSNARVAIIDLEKLAQFAPPGDVDGLRQLQRQVEEYMRSLADRQGLERTRDGYQLTPKAMRVVQRKLLAEIFSSLEAARSGRHSGPIAGEGVVELPRTRSYEFGDSVAHMDIAATFVNAALRAGGSETGDPAGEGGSRPALRFAPRDIEIHRTRNNPKCATVVIMDMSGSMRYGGQYVHCKRMAIALDGLIRSEYPGDSLEFIEMYTFARRRTVAELPTLLPRPVTIYDPMVRLRADMSNPKIGELDVPHHFTNIQRSLQVARQLLSAQTTPNRNIILITDGLPTAHFEGEQLYLLYPPHRRTEEATMAEAARCARERMTINVILLPSWSQSEDDVQFAHRMAEGTGGRVFFSGGRDLDRFVVWDYVTRRRRIVG